MSRARLEPRIYQQCVKTGNASPTNSVYRKCNDDIHISMDDSPSCEADSRLDDYETVFRSAPLDRNLSQMN
jgi:hypothetical protein